MMSSMRDPEDAATHLWGLASEREALAASVLVTRPSAPDLLLASYLYAVRALDLATFESDLDMARARGVRRVVLERDTPAWVEAELRLRGWTAEEELRLELPSDAQLAGSPPRVDIRPGTQVDPAWRARGELLRADHIEEDTRHGIPPRPPAQTAAIVEHRRAMEGFAPYLCAMEGDEVGGFLCTWTSPTGTGVIEDVYVRPGSRGAGIATALLHAAVAELRTAGADRVVIAAEIGDTPAQRYARVGFRPDHVVRSCVLAGG
jgi:GNAT superfamily N-acetyltransferase